MKMRKWLAMGLALTMSMGLVACGATEKTTEGSNPAAPKAGDKKAEGKKVFKFGMITDTGGIHDESFNQSSWEGMEAAKKKLGDQIEISYLESKTDADYLPHIENMIDKGVDVVVAIGFKMANAVDTAAKSYPNQKFAIIDSDGGVDGVIQPNVQGILFRADQTAFLGGYVAGLMTKTKKVGHMNGMNAPTMNEFAAGYYAGVWAADPTIKIYGQYANSFGDVAKGKSIAEQLYSQGCDIIYACAGDAGNGVIESAKEKNLWVIGVDRDQYKLAPKNMLTSTMKRVDVGIMNMIEGVVAGKEFGKTPIVYGLDTGAVGIAPSTENLPADVLEKVKAMEQKLLSGEVKTPRTGEELMKMYPNAPSKFME